MLQREGGSSKEAWIISVSTLVIWGGPHDSEIDTCGYIISLIWVISEKKM